MNSDGLSSRRDWVPWPSFLRPGALLARCRWLSIASIDRETEHPPCQRPDLPIRTECLYHQRTNRQVETLEIRGFDTRPPSSRHSAETAETSTSWPNFGQAPPVRPSKTRSMPGSPG